MLCAHVNGMEMTMRRNGGGVYTRVKSYCRQKYSALTFDTHNGKKEMESKG